jgi:hypothetical protein
MIRRVTPDAAAPNTTSTPSERTLVADAGATSGWSPSLESSTENSTGFPRTPPASLMSWIASSAPAISGGERNERAPVSGRTPPIFRTPSPLAKELVGDDAQPESASAAAATTATAAKYLRVVEFELLNVS